MTKKAMRRPGVQGRNFRLTFLLMNCLILFIFSSTTVHAQTNTIRGKVVDSLGAPLSGVSVTLKNS
ncbi:MAG TPA: carboxypeptidase-like regulatory domain-containing protein, partial [Chitinophagaceae bacterium]|nr:carboxypeptidase-like regulatory domain-containing protein [Chitinophagaceae bacterium]